MQKKIPKLYLLCVKLVNRVLQNVYLPSILSSKKGVDNKLIKLISNIFNIIIIIMIFFQYICENHFQRLQGRSMFTGLKAINHFGRPDMPSFLKFVQKKHSYVSVYLYISSFPRCILLSHSRVLKKLVKKKICMSNSNRNQKKGLKGQCLAIFSGRKF